MQKKVLVTGATGFIGSHVVKRLVNRGVEVVCLARNTSNVSELEKQNCTIAYADLAADSVNLESALAGVGTVIHLAAALHSVNSHDMIERNSRALENVLLACAAQSTPPQLVFVSSLAAVGPSTGSRPRQETDPRQPVSNYGRSKEASELVAMKFASRVPISIVRPPIVLGGGDRHGLDLFRPIDMIGWHFVPGFREFSFSTIHVEDLATALIGVAERGKRLTADSASQGIYFCAADETVTYAGLGKMIGQATGRKRTRILRVPMTLLWCLGAFNELLGRLISRPQFLNLDKYREAKAGSWTCNNQKIFREVGFAPERPLAERLQQTVDWYRQHGWLSKKKIAPAANATRRVSDAR